MAQSTRHREPVSFRDKVPGLLMLFSMVLLLLLQYAWLRSAWHDERDAFRKETNSLLRSTILAMHDSLVLRNIEVVQGDSVAGRGRRYGYARSDSSSASGSDLSVEVYVSPESRDSVRPLIKPLIRKMRDTPGHRRFFVRLGADSLDTDSVALLYSEALAKSGIDLPFTVHRMEREGRGMPSYNAGNLSDGQFVSGPVFFSPVTYYTASFSDTDAFFFKAITPEILFCLFVTLLTSGSFLLMQRSMRSQRDLIKLKNEFISNITHELKTPVATVSVALEALERFEALEDREKTKEYLGMAQDELNRLVLMIDKILQTASFENSAPDMKFEPIDLDNETRAVLKSMKLVFEKRQIQVRYASQGADFVFNGSRAHIVTVLYNLVDNAVKYSPVSAILSIGVAATEHAITLTVEDTGIGIPAEYHQRIFERFFRVPSGDVHNTKGYGLGLNYVAQVVAAHGGEIEVRSEEGKGSCFTIRFPKNTSQ